MAEHVWAGILSWQATLWTTKRGWWNAWVMHALIWEVTLTVDSNFTKTTDILAQELQETQGAVLHNWMYSSTGLLESTGLVTLRVQRFFNTTFYITLSLFHFKVKVTQSCPTLHDAMDYIVHGILQARILEWIAFPFSRRSSQPRDQTQVSCTAGGFFISWATGKPFKHISFKTPDPQDPKITYLCHNFSVDGWTGFARIEATKSPQETVSQTLLHSVQGFINYFWVVQWQVIVIHFSTKGQAVLNTWAICSQKTDLAKKFPHTFVLWNLSSLLCSKKQLQQCSPMHYKKTHL